MKMRRRLYHPLFDFTGALRVRNAFGYGSTDGRGGRPLSGCSGRLLIGLLVAAFAIFQYYSSTTSEVNSFTGRTQHLALSPLEEIKLGLASRNEMADMHGGLSPDAKGRLRDGGARFANADYASNAEIPNTFR